MKQIPSAAQGADMVSLEARLAAALLAGEDTSEIRSAIASRHVKVAADAARASDAAAAERANLDAAIDAAAAVRASESRSALAGRLTQLQPPNLP